MSTTQRHLSAHELDKLREARQKAFTASATIGGFLFDWRSWGLPANQRRKLQSIEKLIDDSVRAVDAVLHTEAIWVEAYKEKSNERSEQSR